MSRKIKKIVECRENRKKNRFDRRLERYGPVFGLRDWGQRRRGLKLSTQRKQQANCTEMWTGCKSLVSLASSACRYRPTQHQLPLWISYFMTHLCYPSPLLHYSVHTYLLASPLQHHAHRTAVFYQQFKDFDVK